MQAPMPSCCARLSLLAALPAFVGVGGLRDASSLVGELFAQKANSTKLGLLVGQDPIDPGCPAECGDIANNGGCEPNGNCWTRPDCMNQCKACAECPDTTTPIPQIRNCMDYCLDAVCSGGDGAGACDPRDPREEECVVGNAWAPVGDLVSTDFTKAQCSDWCADRDNLYGWSCWKYTSMSNGECYIATDPTASRVADTDTSSQACTQKKEGRYTCNAFFNNDDCGGCPFCCSEGTCEQKAVDLGWTVACSFTDCTRCDQCDAQYVTTSTTTTTTTTTTLDLCKTACYSEAEGQTWEYVCDRFPAQCKHCQECIDREWERPTTTITTTTRSLEFCEFWCMSQPEEGQSQEEIDLNQKLVCQWSKDKCTSCPEYCNEWLSDDTRGPSWDNAAVGLGSQNWALLLVASGASLAHAILF